MSKANVSPVKEEVQMLLRTTDVVNYICINNSFAAPVTNGIL